MIGKGPSYREQNFVDWKKICSEAVAGYKHKWSKKDYREWEHRVNENRIRLLEAKNI